MEPKYKVGDFLKHYFNGTVDILHVDFIKFDSNSGEPIYCYGTKHCHMILPESDVIGVIPYDEEEYQLYLKLKEKYG